MLKRRQSDRGSQLTGRLFRSVISIVVLTAFVLFISLFVRELSDFNVYKAVKYAKPLLARLHVKIDEEQIGQVAGEFAQRISQTNIGSIESSGASDKRDFGDQKVAAENKAKPIFSVGLMGDSENDYGNLEKALLSAKEKGVLKVFFLGDLTSFGDVNSLRKGKETLDKGGLNYFIIPGDHDLAQSVGAENFTQIFGQTNHAFQVDKYKFVMLDNSANKTLISAGVMDWFKKEVADADFVILAQPLYHPTNSSVMGSLDQDVKKQADELLGVIRDSHVKAIIAAEQHYSSESTDPVRSDLKHFVIGALSGSRNLQTPRYAILTWYEDGTYGVEDATL